MSNKGDTKFDVTQAYYLTDLPSNTMEQITDQEIDSIVIKLECLRPEFNQEIDSTVGVLLQRVSDLRGLRIETVEHVPRGRTNTLSRSSSEEVDTLDRLIEGVAIRTFPTVYRLTFGPITSPRRVRVGDRVRITNRLNHVTGKPTEQGRLAT